MCASNDDIFCAKSFLNLVGTEETNVCNTVKSAYNEYKEL